MRQVAMALHLSLFCCAGAKSVVGGDQSAYGYLRKKCQVEKSDWSVPSGHGTYSCAAGRFTVTTLSTPSPLRGSTNVGEFIYDCHSTPEFVGERRFGGCRYICEAQEIRLEEERAGSCPQAREHSPDTQ